MCGGPAWKREIVPDHKFDFVDTREFIDNGFGMRMKYLWVYILVLKSFLVYVSDIFTAVTMLTTTSWSSNIFENCKKQNSGCVAIPFTVNKWLFVGCIIFSFLLLAYEARKSKRIIASRDISYAFTNVMANNYYSLRSYDHFCFFDHIQQSTKKSDDFAFFVFFTFKSWKRLFFADGPRQVINALTLFAIYLAKKDNKTPWFDFKKYFVGNNLITTALTISTLFTVVIFAGSMLLLIIAGMCYVPLLCYIKGNLKEYCCYKVDKRISAIIRRRNKERVAEAIKRDKKEAMGDLSHLKNKKGELIHQPLPQPTLPNISIDDDLADIASLQIRAPPSNYTSGSDKYYAADATASYDYPAMPAYNAPHSYSQDANSYARYNPSGTTLQGENHLYEDDHGSTAHLAPAIDSHNQYDDRHPPGQHYESQGYVADPYDVYTGYAAGQYDYGDSQHPHQPGSQGFASQHAQNLPDGVGLTYDNTSSYPDYQTTRQQGHRPPSPRRDGGQYYAV
ncbi:hypothetical protein EDB89DRAFT_1841466 [Lactarius sanguifluus]|nr:hypothetical protein EDB89DRAFT_1841466 [Lactarius sanguifluus]